jgi:hypothetical protein
MCATVSGKWSVIAVLCLCLPSVSLGQESQSAGRTGTEAGYARLVRWLDRNHDLEIDEQELAAGQETASLLLALSWDGCDQDESGSIDVGELAVALAAIKKELAEVDAAAEAQAEEALANAVSLDMVLGRLAADERYAAEIAALREAVADLDDDEAVVSYITRYPTQYPRLLPVIRTWGRYYPVRPELRRHFWRHPRRGPAYVKPKDLRPHPKPRPPKVKPHPKPKPKPKVKPRPKPRRKP